MLTLLEHIIKFLDFVYPLTVCMLQEESVNQTFLCFARTTWTSVYNLEMIGRITQELVVFLRFWHDY